MTTLRETLIGRWATHYDRTMAEYEADGLLKFLAGAGFSVVSTHDLTVCAEACEEQVADLPRDGIDVKEAIRCFGETGRRLRAMISATQEAEE